jgi:Aspartyl protease
MSTNSNNMTEFSVTLVNAASGQSETLPVSPTTLLSELSEWAVALFGINNANASQLHLFKDGKRIVHATSLSLQAAGIQSGDVLAVQQQHRAPQSGGGGGSRVAAPNAASGGGSGGGGLDFSSLLAGVSAPSAGGGSGGGGGGGDDSSTVPVYYPGMSLMDAMEYNPHPRQFCTLLQTKEHLFKELRYHDPQTAAKLQSKSLDEAVQIWRENCVRGGISQAMKQTNAFHERQDMEKRLQNDPNDEIAMAYFAKQDAKKKVQQQYLEMMNEYPESLGRVLMLYVEAKINGHAIQAFCDTVRIVLKMMMRVGSTSSSSFTHSPLLFNAVAALLCV